MALWSLTSSNFRDSLCPEEGGRDVMLWGQIVCFMNTVRTRIVVFRLAVPTNQIQCCSMKPACVAIQLAVSLKVDFAPAACTA